MKNTNETDLLYNSEDLTGFSVAVFENLPETISLPKAEELLNRKVKTFYDWRARPTLRRRFPVPNNLFLKINGRLSMRTRILRQWIALQNLA